MDIGNTVDFLILNKVCNFFNDTGTVNKVRKFFHNDSVLSVCHGLNFANGAHLYLSSSGAVCLFHIPFSENRGSCRKIRSLNNGEKLVNFRLSSRNAVLNDFIYTGNHFSKIMRRNIGRHPYRNSGCSVYEKIRKTRRKHGRLIIFVGEVRHKVNRILIDTGQHFRCHLGHLCLGITHSRRTVSVF